MISSSADITYTRSMFVLMRCTHEDAGIDEVVLEYAAQCNIMYKCTRKIRMNEHFFSGETSP